MNRNFVHRGRNQAHDQQEKNRPQQHIAFTHPATRDKHSRSQRENDAHEKSEADRGNLLAGHTSKKQRQCENRKDRKKVINRVQPARCDLARDNIPTAQISEKKQSQRSFPAFFTQTIRGVTHTREHAFDENNNRKNVQDVVPRKTRMPRADTVKGRKKRQQYCCAAGARQIGPSLSCGDNQFAMEHWKMLDQTAVLVGQIRPNFVLANVQSVPLTIGPILCRLNVSNYGEKAFSAAEHPPMNIKAA